MSTQLKRSGLLVLFLVLLCCLSFVGVVSSAVSVAPVATGSPFQFGLPTPTPAATPQPTPTPVPTPRPEPSARPTLEMYCTSNAAASDLKVTVSGTLTYNHTGIESVPIYAAFSADGGTSWQNFSLVQTRADGSFSTIWMPNATGNYMLSTQWDGNLTLHWLNATLNLALVPDSDGNQFSVVSNSTITNISYNSETRQLSFGTNGTSSTTGYLYVSIPKTLTGDGNAVEVRMDGNLQAFASESRDDVWVISCLYTQSAHTFTVQVPQEAVFSPAETPWVAIVAALVVIVVVIAILLVVRRRRKTAATVASILKDDRPVF